MSPSEYTAPGAPGIQPRWTSSAKDGIGTAYHSSSRLWFTLSHGIVNEIYYPNVDSPNTRDLQFLITDGASFCHEERRDLDCVTEMPEENVLLYRMTNSDRSGRYRIIKEVVGEPHSSVLLMHTRVEILDPTLHGKLRLYALLAPHLKGTGQHNSAWWSDNGGHAFIRAVHDDIHMVLGCAPDFTRRSVGYVGSSDGWQDLMGNFAMDWTFDRAVDGNIALTGEIDLTNGLEFVVAVSFGRTCQSASTQLLQALATPFWRQRERYILQWRRTRLDGNVPATTGDGGRMWRLSQCVLLAHEDKMFPGAFVASLCIPWGEIKDDSDRGGYHLVWSRDLVQSAIALLACGHSESALRALIWLACVQGSDGSLPQNSSIAGDPYWKGIQLDEVAMPILLAWQLHKAHALRQFDPWPLISRAARYLILHGPVTQQERWEENAGYSPSTLATMIAALACAAEFSREQAGDPVADIVLAYSDWLSSRIEAWTVTTSGDLLPGKPRHYIRISPANAGCADGSVDPDTAVIQIANGGGSHLARRIVSGDFLQLVRLGVRAADDPVIVDSVAVIDHVLKHHLPHGSCWRRYNHDGYGQKADGSAFDGTGIGRCWPILTGERGHYELAAGRDPMPFVQALELFANAGGMLPEQLWDDDDQPKMHLRRGGPTGSAMPLCWSHAEYLSLARSAHDGVCWNRAEPAYQRYVLQQTDSTHEMWTLLHPIQRMPSGRTLRILLHDSARIIWTATNWSDSQSEECRQAKTLGLWYADLATASLAEGVPLEFTIFWNADRRWEGRNFSLTISDSRMGTPGASPQVHQNGTAITGAAKQAQAKP